MKLSPRPASELAVGVSFLARSVLGWVAAFPAIAAVSALGTGSLDQGERALFSPSGVMLLELLRRGQTAFSAAAKTAALLLVLGWLVNSVATALLFSVFSRGERDFRRAARAAFGAAPGFVLLGAGELAALGLVLFVGGVLWGALPSLETASGVASAGVALSCGLGLAVLFAIVADLSRAHLLGAMGGIRASVARAIESFRGGALPLASGYVLALGSGALSVALTARGVELCRVELDGAFRVFVAFFLHQASLLALTLIQAGWARRLGRIIEPLRDPRPEY